MTMKQTITDFFTVTLPRLWTTPAGKLILSWLACEALLQNPWLVSWLVEDTQRMIMLLADQYHKYALVALPMLVKDKKETGGVKALTSEAENRVSADTKLKTP
jgi:hypothetical protein